MKDRVVQILLDSSKLLQQATRVHQAKLIADIAAAQQVYAKRQQLGEEVISYAHALKIEALARLGELLREIPKAEGGRPSKTSTTSEPVLVQPETLAEMGIDRKTSAIAQQLAALSPEMRHAIAESRSGSSIQATKRQRALTHKPFISNRRPLL